MHPIDLTKTRLQLSPPGTGMLGVASGIVARDGVAGLYAGLSASIMRQAVYGTARLGMHREFSDSMKKASPTGEISALQSAGSAMLSGALASVIGTPFDVSLVRMQADGMLPPEARRGYKSVFNAVRRIAVEEGVGKLWTGFEPTAFRAVAMNVGMMASYDQAKQAIRRVNGDNLSTNLAASAVSGFCASFTSLPFDMMKTRLQNMKKDPATGKFPYTSVLDCGVKIATTEGVTTFWRGFSAYYTRTAPHAMTILIVSEWATGVYSQWAKTL